MESLKLTPNSPIQQLIVSCLNSQQSEEQAHKVAALLSSVDESVLWEKAREYSLTPIIAHSLSRAQSHAKISPRWLNMHEQTRQRLALYFQELEEVAIELSNRGVQLILLENAAIARTIYDCWGCSIFGDFDLLIRPEDILSAHHCLVQRGYSTNNAIPNLDRREQGTNSGRVEYSRVIANSEELRINLQTSLVARRWFNTSRHEPPIETLFERSQPITDSYLFMLNPIDNLFQLCLHNASHNYFRKPGIRLHLDVERFIRHGPPFNWDDFTSQVSHYRAATICYYALLIPKLLFETPIPDEVFKQLKPAPWKKRLLSSQIEKIGFLNKKRFTLFDSLLFTFLQQDSLLDLWRSIFPDHTWMQNRYGFNNKLLLPFYHLRRFFDLTFHRART